MIPPTVASVSLYPPIAPNIATPFWSRFGHSLDDYLAVCCAASVDWYLWQLADYRIKMPHHPEVRHI